MRSKVLCRVTSLSGVWVISFHTWFESQGSSNYVPWSGSTRPIPVCCQNELNVFNLLHIRVSTQINVTSGNDFSVQRDVNPTMFV